MSTYNIGCDSNMCVNLRSLSTSECDNSYQKSKYRRKKRQSSLRIPLIISAEEDSSRLGCEPISSLKSSECDHHSRLSYDENAQKSKETAKTTCVFDCNNQFPSSSSILSNQISPSRLNCWVNDGNSESKKASLLGKRQCVFTNETKCKSRVGHHTSNHPWHRCSFLIIQLVLLSLFLQIHSADSFGHHGGLTGGGFIGGGLFSKSDKSKMSIIHDKLIRPKSSHKTTDNLDKQKKPSLVESNRMQADSPFEIHNYQEVFRNLE